MRIAIIGGGPGGYVAAIRAAQLGAEVTLIENKHLGGTCLNKGCIPTKVLLHTAELVDVLENEAKELGIKVAGFEPDWGMLQKRKDKIVKKLVGGIDGLLKSNKIIKVMGNASFLSEKQIIAVRKNGGEKPGEFTIVDFDYAVIATGSVPVIIPIPGVDLPGVITSDEALSLESVPESMVIIGGGVIGCEFASIYRAFGCKVTIIEMLDNIIANMDQDIVKPLQDQLIKDGVKIHTQTKVEGIEKTANGLSVRTSSKEGVRSFDAQKVLLSIGRKPVTNNLGLDKVNVEIVRGAIKVNKNMRTNVDNIYAIGDCNGGIMLAHVASAEGVVAVESIMKKKSNIDFRTVPYCVYTKPELAGVGMTEAQAIASGFDVMTGVFPLYASGKAMIMSDSGGLVKYIADAHTGEILGLHMAGPRATDLIVEGALAIRLEATVEELISTIHAHPTVGESLHEAAHAIHGNAIHLMK